MIAEVTRHVTLRRAMRELRVDDKACACAESIADAAAVQLAVYRLAWHHLSGVPLDRIRASFHYVGANRTVRPAALLGHDELVALVRSVPSPDVATPTPAGSTSG